MNILSLLVTLILVTLLLIGGGLSVTEANTKSFMNSKGWHSSYRRGDRNLRQKVTNYHASSNLVRADKQLRALKWWWTGPRTEFRNSKTSNNMIDHVHGNTINVEKVMGIHTWDTNSNGGDSSPLRIKPHLPNLNEETVYPRFLLSNSMVKSSPEYIARRHHNRGVTKRLTRRGRFMQNEYSSSQMDDRALPSVCEGSDCNLMKQHHQFLRDLLFESFGKDADFQSNAGGSTATVLVSVDNYYTIYTKNGAESGPGCSMAINDVCPGWGTINTCTIQDVERGDEICIAGYNAPLPEEPGNLFINGQFVAGSKTAPATNSFVNGQFNAGPNGAMIIAQIIYNGQVYNTNSSWYVTPYTPENSENIDKDQIHHHFSPATQLAQWGSPTDRWYSDTNKCSGNIWQGDTRTLYHIWSSGTDSKLTDRKSVV